MLKSAFWQRLLIIMGLALGLTGCGVGEEEGQEASTEELAAFHSSPASGSLKEIPFTPLSDTIGHRGTSETRRVFTSAAAYERYFGHPAPDVDFSREWVFFYSAGVKPTGGY